MRTLPPPPRKASALTDKKVVCFLVRFYAAQYEALRSGRRQAASVNTGGNPITICGAGMMPFAMIADWEMMCKINPANGIRYTCKQAYSHGSKPDREGPAFTISKLCR